MSFASSEGKHTIVFLSKEESEKASTVVLNDDTNNFQGAILPNGEINWNCPCLGGMASGPCGYEFREAFSCFHHSKAEQKGSDCELQFSRWQECMVEHMDYYGPASKSDANEDDLDNIDIDSFDNNNSSGKVEQSNQQSATKKS